MSSIYSQVQHAEPHEHSVPQPRLLHTQTPTPTPKPKLTGIKFALTFCYFLTMVALLGVAYTYYSLTLESQQRSQLQLSHAQLSERSNAFESAIDEQKALVLQIQDRWSDSQDQQAKERNDIRKEIEKRRLEISNLSKKLKGFEGKFSDSSSWTSTPVAAAVTSAPTTQPAIASGPAIPPNAGKDRVLTVNRQFKFVVINLGLDASAKIGDKMSIVRGGQKVGIIQIEKLYDNFSAATILQENTASPIEVGDSIAKLA